MSVILASDGSDKPLTYKKKFIKKSFYYILGLLGYVMNLLMFY